MVFNPGDCFGCIYDGIQDLKKHRNNGLTCAALAISDKVADIRGWVSVNFDGFHSFYVVSSAAFSHGFGPVKTPIMIHLKKGKIVSHYQIKMKGQPN